MTTQYLNKAKELEESILKLKSKVNFIKHDGVEIRVEPDEPYYQKVREFVLSLREERLKELEQEFKNL